MTLSTLSHYISFQNLLSLHSTDLPIFVSDWFWMKNTNKHRVAWKAYNSEPHICIMTLLLRMTPETKVGQWVWGCFTSSSPVRVTRLCCRWRVGLLFDVLSVKNGSAISSSHPLGSPFCSRAGTDPFHGFSFRDWPSEVRNLKFKSERRSKTRLYFFGNLERNLFRLTDSA